MNRETNLYIKEFIDYLQFEKGLGEKTIISYKVDINSFFKDLQKEYDEIKKEDIYKYIENMKQKFKHNTVQRKVSSIKHFFKFLYINKNIKKDPSNTIKLLQKEKRLPEVLTQEDFEKIIDTFNHEPKNIRDKLILKLLIGSGARISEIINLEVKDVEDNNFEYIRVLGKGSKYRYIPIYENLANELKNYIENVRNLIKKNEKDHKLFPRVRREQFYMTLREHAKLCNIEKRVYPHIIRHSIATMLLKNGADIRMVQELLGHASISTTQIYTHVEKSKLKSIYDNISIGDDIDDNI
ncbi:tyrosine-type recombinase/integrase [Caviibacter abscessus]|uniref:tyrosine-type recombinase/integrase n=1 Tax=Caviibacter abscessus TaxID=1766719 RepID=UPI0009EA29B0|nr:tyrosine-type recombinase/integrase [Caviibacter abscessus]